jgi:hypothetical protein
MPLKQLTIAQYKPGKNDGYSPKDVFNGVDAIDLCNGEQLKLESSKFASCPLQVAISPSFRSRFLHLEDLSNTFIADISKSAYFNGLSVLRITRCQLPSPHRFDHVPNTLILKDINSNVNLLCAVTAWKGENLWLYRCHSFPGLFLETRDLQKFTWGKYTRMMYIACHPVLAPKKAAESIFPHASVIHE